MRKLIYFSGARSDSGCALAELPRHKVVSTETAGEKETAFLAIGNAVQIHPSTWHWLWSETVNRLDSYQLRVNEGQDLDAALEFARYVIWSKLAEVMAPHDVAGALKVDSSFLRWKALELQRTVQDAFRTGKAAPSGNQAPLEAIGHKLDLIAAQLAGLNPEADVALGVRPGKASSRRCQGGRNDT